MPRRRVLLPALHPQLATCPHLPCREGHGTQVAGILAAKTNNSIGVAGLAYQVRLLAWPACPGTASWLGLPALNGFLAGLALEWISGWACLGMAFWLGLPWDGFLAGPASL